MQNHLVCFRLLCYSSNIINVIMASSVCEPIVNHFGSLGLHRRSTRGVIQDYIITFNEEESDIEGVIDKTYDLFENLMHHFKDSWVKARLIAQVKYLRLNERHEEIGQEDYHFASCRAEEVDDAKEFYVRHITKIASRMDSFHQNGSRLVLNRIKHIHIAITICHP